MLQVNILGTSLNSGPFLAHNVPILTARLPFYFYFLDMSTFTVLLAVSRHSVTSTGGAVLPMDEHEASKVPDGAVAIMFVCEGG